MDDLENLGFFMPFKVMTCLFQELVLAVTEDINIESHIAMAKARKNLFVGLQL